MKVRRLLSTPQHGLATDLALLLLRLVAGAAFMLHGWGKIQRPFAWMGPDPFAPPAFQALAALSEFGGGLALILGLLTPVAALGIACTMAVAVWVHMIVRGDPFVASGPGGAWEPAAVYLCVALVVITIGPGRLSVDRVLFGSR